MAARREVRELFSVGELGPSSGAVSYKPLVHLSNPINNWED